MNIKSQSIKYRFYTAIFLFVLLGLIILTDSAFSADLQTLQTQKMNEAPVNTLEFEAIEDADEEVNEETNKSETVNEDFSAL